MAKPSPARRLGTGKRLFHNRDRTCDFRGPVPVMKQPLPNRFLLRVIIIIWDSPPVIRKVIVARQLCRHKDGLDRRPRTFFARLRKGCRYDRAHDAWAMAHGLLKKET